MSQNPGHDDPHHDPSAPRHDADARQHEGGFQAAPSYDAHDGAHGGAPAGAVAKPQSVGLAQKLMYAGGVISLIGGVVALATPEDQLRSAIESQLEASGQPVDAAMVDAAVSTAPIFGLIWAVVVAAIWFALGFFNGKGKGWARIVATVLGVLNVVTTLIGLLGTSMMPGSAAGGTINTILSLLNAVLAAVIVFLLWKKESTAYFKGTR
ncbi:hypothetical protein [Serinicoccus chungangensis]|uniref:hypothetical protein n=1 Tax=Serinicoccus chungangensis TaxID=767452 RepID=UPI00111933D9|nr:hypothetical protein [Serinicoccus chungangensis]